MFLVEGLSNAFLAILNIIIAVGALLIAAIARAGNRVTICVFIDIYYIAIFLLLYGTIKIRCQKESIQKV